MKWERTTELKELVYNNTAKGEGILMREDGRTKDTDKEAEKNGEQGKINHDTRAKGKGIKRLKWKAKTIDKDRGQKAVDADKTRK